MAARAVDVARGFRDVEDSSRIVRALDDYVDPLDRTKSILLKGEVTGPDVIKFVKDRLGSQEALCGCRQIRNGFFELEFSEPTFADEFLGLGPALDMDGTTVTLKRAGDKCTTVHIYGLPFPLMDEVLTHYLEEFGRVEELEHEHWRAPGCEKERTGTRIARMLLKTSPPNYLKIGESTARLNYQGMTKLCAKCFKEGHFAGACRAVLCFNCGGMGHIATECSDPCSKCHAYGHSISDCRKRTFCDVVTSIKSLSDIGSTSSMRTEMTEIAPSSCENRATEIQASTTNAHTKASKKRNIQITPSPPIIREQRNKKKKMAVEDFVKSPNDTVIEDDSSRSSSTDDEPDEDIEQPLRSGRDTDQSSPQYEQTIVAGKRPNRWPQLPRVQRMEPRLLSLLAKREARIAPDEKGI